MNENEREFVNSLIATILIMLALFSLVLIIAKNKSYILMENKYIAIVENKAGDLYRIANPDEYYLIDNKVSTYDFRYNEDLNTVDLVLHYDIIIPEESDDVRTN